MKSRGKMFLLGGVAAVLALAWIAAGYELWQGEKSRALSPSLGERLPRELPGVRIEDIPLGPNELVDATAKEKMEYDDVVNRAYTTAHGTFSVYIGYWARGKRSPSHVAAHIPDRCWTLAGMTCLSRKADYLLPLDGPSPAPGYWRRFKQPNSLELETVFWHVVGNRFYDYGDHLHDFTPPAQRVATVIRDLFVWRQDQYFIRIVSSEPIASFAHDAAFNEVMRRVAALGLAAR